MSLENEDRKLLDQRTSHELEKNRRLEFSYTREFLLSLSELDSCKELPSNFDRSLLSSEFKDALVDRHRSTGVLSTHSFRQNEYSSSPPTRGDTNSFLRGTHGKWDSRSSGRSDKDSDSQSERESDSGKRLSNQSHRPWQGPGHDGLLGSGSSPRPSGFAHELSGPKFRATGNYQLNRANETYQRSGPYKAPHSRRDTRDNLNDETFGSSAECADKDKAEEERKRRASFELMRKEQQKAFQEKQNLNPDKNKDVFDITSLLDDNDDRLVKRSNELAEPPVVSSALSDDSEKFSLAHIVSTSRLLVPPGFASTLVERNSGVKTSTNNRSTEHDDKAGETRSPHAFQSSKFAHWFVEEEKKPLDDFTHRPSDLLSLIVGGEKGGLQVSDLEKTQHVAPASLFQNAEPPYEHFTSTVAHTAIDNNPEQLYKSNIPELVPAVLTCEDLEQSILSQVKENGLSLQQPMQGKDSYTNTEQSNSNSDNHASQQLLSLLQKGTCHKDTEQSSIPDVHFPDMVCNTEGAAIANIHDDPGEASADVSKSSKQLTLETLFGTAFMKELQSVGAPLSVQRGSVESAGADVSDSIMSLFPASDNGLPHAGKHALNRHGSAILPSERTHQWLGFGDPQGDVNSLQLQSKFIKASGINGPNDIHFPEEDSLTAVGDPLQNFLFAGNSGKTDLSQDIPIDITGKRAALNPAFRVERPFMGNQEGLAYSRSPYDMREPGIPYQNLNVHRSSRLQPPQLNHMGPMFNQLDSQSHPPHMSPFMKLKTPDGMVHHESLTNYHFPGNMKLPPFDQPSNARTGFDPPAHHSMLQQMHMQGNLPPPHLFRGFPGGVPPPVQPSNPMQSFPFSGHHQSPFGVSGMPLQASDVASGRNDSEMLQRLFEMELRSRARPGI
ncbi:PREDICTED: uncharacterized protein LOC109330976 isoform X8 [Lupinus angustifolius]|uniref:uncharacterized protein LOC109330976 isoform X8 n=1 Tax=Lupinus angustifolius TaxID=3871 RepID=UPI00092F948F|nr:PREDICTED: uncharacterized protein LOC109330976 isoform X8 [Lupinus angustifolius]